MSTVGNSSLFSGIQTAPPDPILGLTEAFRNDPNPDKINLSVGVYQDETGITPVMRCVKIAEQQLIESEKTKSYLPIQGIADYNQQLGKLLFGADGQPVTSGRIATLQTPGGTGALRVAADFLKTHHPAATIWCSRPTWANHPNVFRSAELKVENYAYLDDNGTGLDFNAMIDSLNQIPAGDIVCLHACCHNPTGVDPDQNQWNSIIEVISQRNLIPLVDFAYQGFGAGIEEDANTVRAFAESDLEFIVCNSFSKNFGLYGERIGGLTLVSKDAETAKRALSQAKLAVRANYSNPPKHGGAIVNAVLSSDELRSVWLEELSEMRLRIKLIREKFVEQISDATRAQDFSFITSQNGMFSFSGLTGVQVDELRTKHSIYIVGSGRINVAGINESNIGRLCDAISKVVA